MTYRPGDFWRICDISGRKVRSSQTVKQWDGLIVDRSEYEDRHPQDFVRGRVDRQAVRDARPVPAPVYAGPTGGPFFLVEDEGGWRFEGGMFRAFGAAAETVSESDF